jgi:hypothetical protein
MLHSFDVLSACSKLVMFLWQKPAHRADRLTPSVEVEAVRLAADGSEPVPAERVVFMASGISRHLVTDVEVVERGVWIFGN